MLLSGRGLPRFVGGLTGFPQAKYGHRSILRCSNPMGLHWLSPSPGIKQYYRDGSKASLRTRSALESRYYPRRFPQSPQKGWFWSCIWSRVWLLALRRFFYRLRRPLPAKWWNQLRFNLGRVPRTTSPTLAFLGGSSALVFTRFDRVVEGSETREQRMIDYSQQELAATNDHTPGNKVREYVVEPFLTWLRFFLLAFIFLPVIITMPVLLVPWSRTALLWYKYVTWSLEMAGPSFIKLGQWAASRSDIFPRELCRELGKLHSNAKQHSLAHTRRTISLAFNRPFEECFTEFDDQPLGVGAMAQVYRAKPAPGVIDNAPEYVAVKVLHPRIEHMVERDLCIMGTLAKLINALPTMEWLSLPGEVATFAKMMRAQLDLRIEAENLRIFAHNYQGWDDVTFPRCYLQVSTRSVLVEELVQGISMEKVLQFCQQTPLDRRVAALGLDAFLKMLLLHNFIHSDLHAGNIILRFPNARNPQIVAQLNAARTQEEWSNVWTEAENETPHICFIDAGLVTELTPRNRHNFIDLFKAIATFDGYRAGELMVERSRTPETALNAEVFALRTQKLVDQVKRRTFALGSVKLGDLLTNMMEMVRAHHVRMESDFITVVLSILLLEGIGRRLNPDLDIFKSALPILRRVSSETLSESSLSADDIVQMVKVWLVLEARVFVTASVQDIYNCVKYDRLSPNE